MGELLTYTLTVTNNGPSAATGAVIRDTLPANATFVSASSGCTESGGVVTCDVGDLANGASDTREIVVRPTAPGTLNNEATATSDTADPNDQNNGDTATTMVQPEPTADLSIENSARPEPVTVGKKLTYTLTMENGGPDTATGVVVEDRLPRGVTFVSASKGCKNSRGTVTCNAGRMTDGTLVTKKIVVQVRKAGELRNTATVGGDTDDSDLANNADTESTMAKSAPTGCEATPGSGKVIKGTRGDDALRGTPGDDTIFGFGGDDVIDGGGGGSKALSGGAGNDTIRGGGGTDAIDGGSGRDKIYGEGRRDALDVSDGARGDLASGGSGRDACSSDRGDRVKGCP